MTSTARVLASACPLDCPDACSLDVAVENGKVAGIDGNRANPLTAGFICHKVHHFADRVYGPLRLKEPLRRVGTKGEGRFEAVSWNDALDAIVAKVREVRDRYGGESILPYNYGGSNGFLTQNAVDARFFRRIGASRLLRTVCAAPSSRAADGLYGKMTGTPLEDYEHARLIVLWGVNPSASGIHLVPIVRKAQKAGGKLAVVDPRRTPLAKLADVHLAPRPGTDVALAMAIHRWLFENGKADSTFLGRHAEEVEEFRRRAEPWTIEKAASRAGVEARDVERLAALYAESSPAVIRCGWGVERNRNGGSAVAAILALPAVAGKFGVRGGGYTMSNSPAWNVNIEPAVAEPEPPTRAVNMNQLGRALLELDDPPIHFLFVYNSNALATSPDQERVRTGLAREDLFTVVFDQVMTDTATYADLVLPATTFLEHDELKRGYGGMTLQRSHPVIEPVGQARANHDVFSELLERLGLVRRDDPKSPEEIARLLIASTGRGTEVQEAMRETGAALPDPPRGVQFIDHFPRTRDKRIHLVPEALDREAPAGLYAYREVDDSFPLTMISPASNKTITSTLGELVDRESSLGIHPDDAAARGIQDGGIVRVFNRLGEVVCAARVDADLRPGVCELAKGLWSRHTRNGRTANALAPDSLTDLGGGACFNDARVEVEPAVSDL